MHLAAPGAAGGLESVVLGLTSGLQRLGHRSVLAVVLDPGAEDSVVPRTAEALGVEVARIVVPPRAYFREYRGIQEAIARFKPDIVHTHGYRADLIGGWATRRAGVPWVSTAHGFVGGDRKNRVYEWLQARSHRSARAVIAVSAQIQDRLARAGVSPGTIHLLPNAIDPRVALSREQARGRLGGPAEPPVIGWVGRLTPEKGADLFLEALALLADRPWLAIVLGDGVERAALEAQALRLGIGHRIRWRGIVADAAILYPAFDVWVLSSRTEGTPVALLEAMSAEVPAIVTAVGGVPAVVSEHEALLVPPENPRALADAIGAVLSDPIAAAHRAKAARQRLRDGFSPGRWLESHIRLYQALHAPQFPGA
jgi:glycosyltransferase involved in cell wall biosynthesis